MSMEAVRIARDNPLSAAPRSTKASPLLRHPWPHRLHHPSQLKRILGQFKVPDPFRLPPLFKRPIGEGEYGLALVEAVAHLNYLLHRGDVRRFLNDDGIWMWERA